MPNAKLVREYVKKNPDMGNRTLARLILKEHPGVYDSIDHARDAVKWQTGSAGVRGRAEAKIGNSVGADYTIPPSCDNILVMSDLQIPFHDPDAIDEALQTGEDEKINTIILNGDITDGFQLSRFIKTENYPLDEEIEMARSFLCDLRNRFPDVVIYYKEGNHEQRMEKFLSQRAPELLAIKEFRWDILMECGANKIEYVKDCRPLVIKDLWVYHGHEFGRGVTGGLNPARKLMQWSEQNSLCGHVHRTDVWRKTKADGVQMISNTIGCLCILNPRYMPIQHPERRWNRGFALIKVDDHAHVENIML